MSQSLSSQVAEWLKQLQIPVSKKYLSRQLLSHPDYPSLLSIVDIMDELNIENTAIEITKERLSEIPVPFMAHLGSNGGEFVIVKNRNDLDKQFPKFFERWNGIVALAEKPVGWNHEESRKWIQKEKNGRTVIIVFFCLLTAFVIASLLFSPQWKQVGLSFIAGTGIFTSWLIVSKDLGFENKIADEVCGKENDCDSIVKSKGAKLPFGISWSDVGVIWFSFLLLSLLITSFTKTSFDSYILLSAFATSALPFIFFSVYYQWQVAKKWCRLCLITALLLWIQFIIFTPQLQKITNWKIEWNSLILLGLILFLVTGSWFAIKSLLKTNRRIELENFANLRFKNNPEIFIALLQKQKRVDTTPFENDLQLGNPGAEIQIMVACNPYCAPCAKAHEILNELGEKNDVGLTVRFAIKTGNKEDKKFKAVEYLLQLAFKKETDYKRRLMHDWYKKMDMEEFPKQHRLLASTDVEIQLKQHEEWSNQAEISFTPAIFINGCELPKRYSVEDLTRLIRNVELNKTTTIENNYAPA